MNRLAKLGCLILLPCGALAIGSGYLMAQRASDFNAVAGGERWHFEDADSRRIEFFGRTLAFTDAKLDDGRNAMRVTYGDKSLLLEVKDPPADLPDLSGYKEWFRPVYFAPIIDGDIGVNWKTREGVRLAIVNRSTVGYDASTWGSVRAKDWQFDIIEVTREGDLVQRRMQFPDRRGRLPAKLDDPNTTVQLLEPRSWEWGVALYAVPRLQISRFRYGTDAINGTLEAPGVGWTLTAAGFSAFGAMIGAGLLLASTVRRPAAANPSPTSAAAPRN